MADLWRAANLLGTAATYSLVVAVGVMYQTRFRSMRLGRRRMMAPSDIWGMGFSYATALAFMAWVTIGRFDSPLAIELQSLYSCSLLLSARWLVHLVSFQIMHSPPPAGPGERRSPDEAERLVESRFSRA